VFLLLAYAFLAIPVRHPEWDTGEALGALNLRVPAAPLLTELAYRKHILRF
jgi:hypothetical protein